MRNEIIETAIEVFNVVYPNGVRLNNRGEFPKHYETGFSGTFGDTIYVLIVHSNQYEEICEYLDDNAIKYSNSFIQSVKNHVAINISLF